MQINNLNYTKNRRARFIVATANLLAKRDHTTKVPLKKFICIIVSFLLNRWFGKQAQS